MNFDTLHWIHEGMFRTVQDRFEMGSLSLTYLSSAMLFNMNFDLSLTVAVIGAFSGAVSIAKNGLDAFRTYLAIKKDKLQAEKMMKDLDDDKEPDDSGANI